MWDADTALVVIDMQRDFCEPGGYVARANAAAALRMRQVIPCIARVLALARARGWLVLHTREGHKPDLSDLTAVKRERAIAFGAPIGSHGPLGRILVRGEPGNAIIAELAPVEGELILDKAGYSCFHGTGLDAIFTARQIRQVVVVGVTTETCVSSTMRHGTEYGYRCLVIEDATAPLCPGLHEPSMAMIEAEGGIFGWVASTATWGL